MSSKTYVLNSGIGMTAVSIVNGLGEKDEIFVMPGGRPYLTEGWSVPPQFLFENPQIKIEVVEDSEGA